MGFQAVVYLLLLIGAVYLVYRIYGWIFDNDTKEYTDEEREELINAKKEELKKQSALVTQLNEEKEVTGELLAATTAVAKLVKELEELNSAPKEKVEEKQ